MAAKTKTASATNAPINMFAAAAAKPVVEQPKAGRKKAEVTHPMSGKLDQLASLKAFAATIEAQMKALESELKGDATDELVKRGMAIGGRPANYKGESATAIAGVELRLRSSASILSEDEVKLLAEENIEATEMELSPEMYAFNPGVLGMGPKVLEKISAALASVKELEGIQVIVHHPAKTKMVASEEAIDKVFKLKDADKVRSLMPLVTTLALKPKLKPEVALGTAFESMRSLLVPNTDNDAPIRPVQEI